MTVTITITIPFFLFFSSFSFVHGVRCFLFHHKSLPSCYETYHFSGYFSILFLDWIHAISFHTLQIGFSLAGLCFIYGWTRVAVQSIRADEL